MKQEAHTRARPPATARPPAERNPFSLHNLCLHGRRCGVVPGRWLGPWVMCRTLEAAAAAAQVRRLWVGF